MKFLKIIALLTVGFLSMDLAAQERGTADEAVAMAQKAIVAIKANKDAAYKAINDKDNDKQFHNKGLYVGVVDMQGTTLAHGVSPGLINKNIIDMKDPDGVFLVREFVKVAQSGKPGWVDYKWPHPETKKLEQKRTYVEPVDAQSFVIVGIYKPSRPPQYCPSRKKLGEAHAMACGFELAGRRQGGGRPARSDHLDGHHVGGVLFGPFPD